MQMTKNIKLLTSLLISLLLLSACAAAARVLYPVSEDPLAATPGVYTLDPTHANIIFAVNHLGFSLHHGRFNKINGSLTLDPAKPEAAKVFVGIDTASIDTNSAELDEKLRAKAMFDTEKFPQASFESTSIKVTGPRQANVNGHLTIKGVRMPVVLQAKFIGTGTNPLTGRETIGFSGTATINRSDFGLKQWLPLVGDKVDLILEAEFNRAKE